MHQAADEALRRVAEMQRQQGFMGDLGILEMADALIAQAEQVRAQAGPRVSLASLERQLTEGMDDGPTPPA